MPIRAELRKFYGRSWRNGVRPRILERAGNRCEMCAVENHAEVYREGRSWLDASVPLEDVWRFGWDARTLERSVRIVLTIAHLNHQAGDDRDENLMALCQWCHLNYDKQHHAETRALRKDLERPLLSASS